MARRLGTRADVTNEGEATARLIAECADRAGVQVEVLHELLALEPDFPDFTKYGAKTEFQRRIAAILDRASKPEEPAP